MPLVLEQWTRTCRNLVSQCTAPTQQVVFSIEDITNGDGQFLLDRNAKGTPDERIHPFIERVCFYDRSFVYGLIPSEFMSLNHLSFQDDFIKRENTGVADIANRAEQIHRLVAGIHFGMIRLCLFLFSLPPPFPDPNLKRAVPKFIHSFSIPFCQEGKKITEYICNI